MYQKGGKCETGMERRVRERRVSKVLHPTINKERVTNNVCPHCSSQFLYKYLLSAHVTTHHHPKGECKACDEQSKIERLDANEKEERKFIKKGVTYHKCNLCGEVFLQRATLEDHHMNRHTILWPFKCTCGAKFSYRPQWKMHAKRERGPAKHGLTVDTTAHAKGLETCKGTTYAPNRQPEAFGRGHLVHVRRPSALEAPVEVTVDMEVTVVVASFEDPSNSDYIEECYGARYGATYNCECMYDCPFGTWEP